MTGETIAALASAPGVGAISLIRMSGPRTLEICDVVFTGKRVPSAARDRSVLLGEITDPGGAPIDQVLLIIMRGPRSLTGEDVVEITCHGGSVAPRLVLRRLIGEGARHAEPGEFTKRAFLNGKMDLAQAEAVSEIVHAKTEKALRVAVRQLRGDLSERFSGIEQELLTWLALIEANIDFTDEGIEPVDTEGLSEALDRAAEGLEHLARSHEQGRYIKDGIEVVIVGKPNVGKSSLFNRLVGQDRVIVSEVPGTTRDVVDGCVGVDGLMLRLRDTAGVRHGSGPIEAEALRRTRVAIEDADLALIVLDASLPLSHEDMEIAEEVYGKPHLFVVNKTDLPQRADVGRFGEPLRVSALRGWGLGDLLEEVRRVAHAHLGDLELEVVVSERHASCIREALRAVLRARQAVREITPLEVVASDIRSALDRLGEVTGKQVGSRVLDEIFSRFCIGK